MNDDVVIVTGTSYADATKKRLNNTSARPNAGKNVRITEKTKFQNKSPSNFKSPPQTIPNQGSRNPPINTAQQEMLYRYNKQPEQRQYNDSEYQYVQRRKPVNYRSQNTYNTYEANYRSNNFLYRGNRQNQRR